MNNQRSAQYIGIGAVVVLILAFAYLIYASKPTDAEVKSKTNPITVINTVAIKNIASQVHSRQNNGVTSSTSSGQVSPVSRPNPFQSE